MNDEQQKYDRLIALLRSAEPEPADPDAVISRIAAKAEAEAATAVHEKRRPLMPKRIAGIAIYAAAVFLLAAMVNEQTAATVEQPGGSHMGLLYRSDMTGTYGEGVRQADEFIRERIRAAEKRRIMRERILNDEDNRTK